MRMRNSAAHGFARHHYFLLDSFGLWTPKLSLCASIFLLLALFFNLCGFHLCLLCLSFLSAHRSLLLKWKNSCPICVNNTTNTHVFHIFSTFRSHYFHFYLFHCILLSFSHNWFDVHLPIFGLAPTHFWLMALHSRCFFLFFSTWASPVFLYLLTVYLLFHASTCCHMAPLALFVALYVGYNRPCIPLINHLYFTCHGLCCLLASFDGSILCKAQSYVHPKPTAYMLFDASMTMDRDMHYDFCFLDSMNQHRGHAYWMRYLHELDADFFP